MAPVEQLEPDPGVDASHRVSASRLSGLHAAVAQGPDRPRRAMRAIYAYWTTLIVVASYLSFRVQCRFRSARALARIQKRKHLSNARRIERTIVRLQGLFIKVGQLISIMTNFLPKEFRDQLEGLQDNVPPRPFREIRRRVVEELGAEPSELYKEFEPTPIAAASIGQVHVATLHNGEPVAVKIQYPDIEALCEADLRTLRRVFGIIAFFTKYQGLDEVYREIQALVGEELDFCAEAANSKRIASNFEGQDHVVFPSVIDELSTARVLTTRFERGSKIADLAALEQQGIDRSRVARTVIEAYCQQIFVDGVYHADPHPGNLLVRPGDGGRAQIVFLDFGAVAEISEDMRHGIVELLQGGLASDTDRIVRAMKQMGFVSRTANSQVFERVVEYFHTSFQRQISLDSFNLQDIRFNPDIGLEKLADLRRMDVTLRELSEMFHIPKEWIILERTFLLLIGLCTTLDPKMNPMSVIKPYLERFVLGPEGDWSSLLVETTKDVAVSLAALPSDARKFIRAARGGELSVRFDNLERSSRLIYRLGHQLITAAIGIAGAAIAIVLEGRGQFDRAEMAWWLAKGAGALLIWSIWTNRVAWRRK